MPFKVSFYAVIGSLYNKTFVIVVVVYKVRYKILLIYCMHDLCMHECIHIHILIHIHKHRNILTHIEFIFINRASKRDRERQREIDVF